MNPHIINCLYNGYKERIYEQDRLQHLWWGNYGLSAVSVAVAHCLAGEKCQAKYIENPVLKELEEQNKPLEEDELKLQRELFLAKLEVMKTNFELSNKKPKGGKQC